MYHIYIYIYIYMYHTMPDVCTAALLPTKPSSDDVSRFSHGFEAEFSLPPTPSAPAITHDTTGLFSIVVTLWDWDYHADTVKA